LTLFKTEYIPIFSTICQFPFIIFKKSIKCVSFFKSFNFEFVKAIQRRKAYFVLFCFVCVFQARTGTWVEPPTFRKLASSHERIKSPCRDSNPQRWGGSGLKSTTLTTRPRTPQKCLYHFKDTLVVAIFLLDFSC
jgi:hypothetical protein